MAPSCCGFCGCASPVHPEVRGWIPGPGICPDCGLVASRGRARGSPSMFFSSKESRSIDTLFFFLLFFLNKSISGHFGESLRFSNFSYFKKVWTIQALTLAKVNEMLFWNFKCYQEFEIASLCNKIWELTEDTDLPKRENMASSPPASSCPFSLHPHPYPSSFASGSSPSPPRKPSGLPLSVSLLFFSELGCPRAGGFLWCLSSLNFKFNPLRILIDLKLHMFLD